MKKSLTLLALTVVGALGIGGAVRGVYANQGQRPAAEIAQSTQSSTTLAQDNDAAGEQADDPEDGERGGDQQETAQLQSLAKITAQQAQQTAEAAQGATATGVELDAEDGSLVYEVKFADAEVLVDAGNGQILHTEVTGQEEDDATEAPIQGSIQVPDHDQE